MKSFSLYTAPTTGSSTNTLYPTRHTITTGQDLKKAVGFDHVSAQYVNHRRSSSGFVSSDCVVMDIDNDHSETPADWITPTRLADLLGDVEFWSVTSRSDMAQKGAAGPRPRLHVYFPINTQNDAGVYAALKKRLSVRFGFFDANALDAARFIYGHPTPTITYHDGHMVLDEWLDGQDDADMFAAFDEDTQAIGEGSRNATMSRFAGRVLVRYGNSEQARDLFDNKAARCEPPLPDAELEAIWASACRFATKVSSDPSYVPPEVYEALYSIRPDDFTDVGQASVMAAVYANQICYSPSTGWMVYDKGVWEENEPKVQYVTQELTSRQLDSALNQQAAIQARAEEAGVLMMLKAMSKTKALASFDPAQARIYQQMMRVEEWIKFIYKCRSDRAIVAVMRQARPLCLIRPEVLDADPYLLNTPSATYDLRTQTAKDHDATDMLTKQTALDPSAKGQDVWFDALNVTFGADSELIGYVQRVCGLAAIGKVLIEALIIAYGDGNNGKSTFWNTIARVLGSYAETISSEVLIAGKKNNAKHEMAETRARRLLIAGENDEGVRLSTSSTKQLASTDKIAAEKKYKDPFSFTPSHTLVLYTNHLPRVGAMDTGIWRRLIVIPFEQTIKADKDIKNYADYLYHEAGEAVLEWIMQGARLIHAENYHLVPPAQVVNASEAYRAANDWFAHFIDTCCEVGDGLEEKSKDVYDTYRSWALSQGEYVRNAADFYAALDKAGFNRRRTREAKLICGLCLNDDYAF